MNLTSLGNRLDFLLFSPRMSKQTNPLLISALSVLGYTSWMEHAATKNFRFPYPFLGPSHSPKPTASSNTNETREQMDSTQSTGVLSTSLRSPSSSLSSTSRTQYTIS
jgi:hypothetical protein